ncbi:DUF4175 domain-containing protein [Oceanihabitans sp. IOP_32]|nr:hypothetical protein [Oceanihabitans sp. IOP_32]QFZ54855.1 DUF4175 domain-containing protein [Oceanihabitans sp. IOP_32]
MKALTIILSMIGLVSLNSCTQETNPQAVLENPETRTEVFNDIAQNDDYMTEFMENMHNNPQAMQMMQGNKNMMDAMMQGEGMQMMMEDGMMMHSMMDGMMKMMHEKGMMSEDCMESCSKMMGEKGMDMQGMDKMDDMDSPTKGEHTEHH